MGLHSYFDRICFLCYAALIHERSPSQLATKHQNKLRHLINKRKGVLLVLVQVRMF